MKKAERALIERLDECLLDCFNELKSRESVSIGDLYHLQDMCEIHCYLKTEHTYTRADLEALLRFRNPLMAAQAAREDNTRAYTFPIAEILSEIKAFDTFELVTPPVPQRDNAAERNHRQSGVTEARMKPTKSRDDAR